MHDKSGWCLNRHQTYTWISGYSLCNKNSFSWRQFTSTALPANWKKDLICDEKTADILFEVKEKHPIKLNNLTQRSSWTIRIYIRTIEFTGHWKQSYNILKTQIVIFTLCRIKYVFVWIQILPKNSIHIAHAVDTNSTQENKSFILN